MYGILTKTVCLTIDQTTRHRHCFLGMSLGELEHVSGIMFGCINTHIIPRRLHRRVCYSLLTFRQLCLIPKAYFYKLYTTTRVHESKLQTAIRKCLTGITLCLVC